MGELQNLNWGLIAPIIILNLILVVFALVDCIRSPRVNGPKWAWILVILVINMIGPVLYFVLGRRRD